MAQRSVPPDAGSPDPADATDASLVRELSTAWLKMLTAFEQTVKVINAGDPPDVVARATLDLRIAAVDLDRTVVSQSDGDGVDELTVSDDPLPVVADVAEVLVAQGPIEQWSDTQLLLGAAYRLAVFATARSVNMAFAEGDLPELLRAARTVIASTEPLPPPSEA